MLEEFKVEGIMHYAPIFDVCTRWISIFDMIDGAFTLKEAIELYAKSKEILLDNTCWDRFQNECSSLLYLKHVFQV